MPIVDREAALVLHVSGREVHLALGCKARQSTLY